MSNPSSKLFDPQLQQISHYQSYPAMLPFVGQDYVSVQHVKMLLVGESFYFPEESIFHKSPENWHGGNQSQLSKDEIEYINCRQLLECPWGSAGHKMYREINRCLSGLGLDGKDRPISHISFTNAFVRPAANSGQSFKHCASPIDREKSLQVTIEVISALQPDLVVYVSKFAWDYVGWQVAKTCTDSAFRFTSHPANPFHWNRRGYAHGRPKFLEILQGEFMRVPSASASPIAS